MLDQEPKIIFEDENILVIDKPAGLEVAAEREKSDATLADWLVEKYPAISKVGPDPARPGIVHRLDKNASGLLLVAKTEAALELLQKQFKERTVKKEYKVLVEGVLTQDEGTIEFPIARANSGRFASLPLGSEAGRMAITEYEVIKRFKKFTLLLAQIKTGRTHQIRVHFFALGYPVVGDKLYRSKKTKELLLPRLFLHASKVIFTDLNGEQKEFESDLPEELKIFLDTLK
ncbi:RNA pseudouridine synthase [Patescibacteria group bacterium]|nr:RNA pseudouridine synthase [Patescibacteria group bacterium]